MARFKLNLSAILLISSLISCGSSLNLNPVSTQQVLGQLSRVDMSLNVVNYWQTFLKESSNRTNTEIEAELKKLVDDTIKIAQLDRVIVIEPKIPLLDLADLKIHEDIRDVLTAMSTIDYLWGRYFMTIINKTHDSILLNQLIDAALNSYKIPFEIDKINRLLHSDGKTAFNRDGLLRTINNQLKYDPVIAITVHSTDPLTSITPKLCDENFTPQQWLFSFYANIIITETRAYLLTHLAYEKDAELRAVSYQNEMNSLAENFINRLSNHVQVIRSELSTSPRSIRRCDPSSHKRDETYLEFEKLMQPYIVNEDLFPQTSERCTHCENLPSFGNRDLKHTKKYAHDPIFRPCNGTIYGCNSFGSYFHRGGDVCLLPENNVKRYGWIKSTYYGSTYGDNSHCDGTEISLEQHAHSKMISRWMGMTDDEFCKYCLCICSNEYDPRTVRSVSIRDQLSNLGNNMVITGVRLVQNNRIIHIQIKQGKVLPGGTIEAGSESWVPLEEMNLMNNNIIELSPSGNLINRRMSRGGDYVYIDELNNNIVLQDMMAKSGSIVVGVSFTAMEHRAAEFKGIGLRIMTAPLNWTTGEVGEGKWLRQPIQYNDIVRDARLHDNARIMANLDDPLKPKSNLPSIEHAVIKLSMSDMDKTAGQNVVPFLDALPVETNPAFPLSGIGLFYKAAPGYGGFISPRIYNADLTNYMTM